MYIYVKKRLNRNKPKQLIMKDNKNKYDIHNIYIYSFYLKKQFKITIYLYYIYI